MARKTPPPTQVHAADLTAEQMQQGIVRLRKRLQQVESFEPGAITSSDDGYLAAGKLEASIDDALARTFEINTAEYNRFSGAKEFGWHTNIYAVTPLSEIQRGLESSKKASISLLTEAVNSLEERLEEMGALQAVGAAPARPTIDTTSRKIFLVHGQNVGARETVARFLEQAEFSPIILHEQPNQGRTIIEKFEVNSDVGFAIVLMTPDDTGGAIDGEQHPRARQNVVLELGYFIGRLGRDRVCALKSGALELPSDILGIVWIDFDSAGGWKTQIAKELQAAGYPVDWNKVMGG